MEPLPETLVCKKKVGHGCHNILKIILNNIKFDLTGVDQIALYS